MYKVSRVRVSHIRYFCHSRRCFREENQSSDGDVNSTRVEESKHGSGKSKFKIDWTDKRQRHQHAAVHSNPVIKPYHKSKKPFAVYEQNMKEDKDNRLKLMNKNQDDSDSPVAETKIQRKLRELEEEEKLRYYTVDEYKVGQSI